MKEPKYIKYFPVSGWESKEFGDAFKYISIAFLCSYVILVYGLSIFSFYNETLIFSRAENFFWTYVAIDILTFSVNDTHSLDTWIVHRRFPIFSASTLESLLDL